MATRWPKLGLAPVARTYFGRAHCVVENTKKPLQRRSMRCSQIRGKAYPPPLVAERYSDRLFSWGDSTQIRMLQKKLKAGL